MKRRIVVLTQVFMLLVSLVVFVPVESMDSLSINAPSQVDEGEVFQVNVTVGDDPIEGAEVIWQGERYLTNSDGIVDLTAPLVDESAYHTICAEHPEYISACMDPGIRVIDIGTLPLNIALEPSTVLEGENFIVTVTSNEDPVYNATIIVGWGTPWHWNFTDKNGQVTLTATSVSEDTTYSINASKTGYTNMTADLIVLQSTMTLRITAPSTVSEGTSFEVTAVEESQLGGVGGVLIEFNNHDYYTNASGKVSLGAPMIEEDTNFQIVASKSGYTGDSSWITVEDNSTELPSLIIILPTSVFEGENFVVWIKSESFDQPIENVLVTFNYNIFLTDENGEVTFTAPSVGDDIEYPITANKEGYNGDIETITVLNIGDIDPEPTEGWITGTVTDDSQTPLKDALICIVQTYEENKCAYSDGDGTFTILSSAGTFSVQARKDGYISLTQEAIIIANTSTELHFILQEEEIPSVTSTDVNQQLVENEIRKEIINGNIGAKINVDGGRGVVSYFSDEIKIKLNIDKDIICIVNASEGTPGTILVFQIEESDISSLKEDIDVKFDGEILNEVTDVEAFFNLQENTESCWLRVLTLNGLYVFVSVQHFSEHTITISYIAEVAETIINITAVSLYIVIIMVLAVVTAIPIIRLWKKIE